MDNSDDHFKPPSDLLNNHIRGEFNKLNHTFGNSEETIDDYISLLQNEEKIDKLYLEICHKQKQIVLILTVPKFHIYWKPTVPF